MIWVTGDCHSDFNKFRKDVFFEQENMTKDDVMIICGDFGGVWYQEHGEFVGGELRRENKNLDWLDSLPFTTVFVDGNHENFDRLNAYPVQEWNGGKVHVIRPSVLHLMRGEVFTIDNTKIFAFGGASSHDIQYGILDYNDEHWREQAKALERDGKYMYRVKGLTWWEQELPTEEEMQNGINNLEKHGNKVDYIITHSPCASVIALLGKGLYKQDKLTQYLEKIRQNTECIKHICGHMHLDKYVTSKDIILYDQIVQIG